MFKRFPTLVLLSVFALINCLSSDTFAKTNNKIEISNEYFSFSMPYQTNGKYNVNKENNGIYIYEKISQNSGFGGFAFGINIFSNPQDYATIPGYRKLGELITPANALYDMVFIRPTEIQYVDKKGVRERYNQLYNSGDKIEIKGINGNTYIKNNGMKGENLYHEILEKYKKAITEQWPSQKYEEENMGYVYYILSKSNKNMLDKIGYTYYDLNSDGTDELLIGEMSQGNSKGIIYDIYTMVNRTPTHVISGGNTEKYFVCKDVFICSEFSSGTEIKSLDVLILEENSTNLYPQIKFLYNSYKNNKKPWFIKYGNSENWENVSEKIYRRRKKGFSNYKRFDFIPLSKFK